MKKTQAGPLLPDSWEDWKTLGVSPPQHVFHCEEASASVVEAIGTSTLTAPGSPRWQCEVTGWREE